ncbi:MAG: PilZ domain-containing protein [Desulfoferrobacter sp.]
MDKRRQFARCLVKEPAYALVYGRDFSIGGRIDDLSKGGIALEYIDYEPMPTSFMKLDIFSADHGFYISEIPCKVIYNIKCRTNCPSFSGLVNRRCGLKFVELKRDQLEELAIFLSKRTRKSETDDRVAKRA